MVVQLGRLVLFGLSMVVISLFTAQSPASAVFAAGDSYQLPADEVITKDLFVIANEIVIDGTVEGDLAVIGRRVLVNGTIRGNTNVLAARIELNGRMRGLIRTIGASQITPATGAAADGLAEDVLHTSYGLTMPVAQIEPPARLDREEPWWRATALLVVGIALLSAALLWLTPQTLIRPACKLEDRPWVAVVAGLLTAQFFLFIPLGTLLLAFLMAFFWSWFPAVLLAIFIMAGMGLVWFLSPLITGVWIGRLLNKRLDRPVDSRPVLILGVVLVALLGQIPTVGWIVLLVSYVLAVGALAAPRQPVPATAAVAGAPVVVEQDQSVP